MKYILAISSYSLLLPLGVIIYRQGAGNKEQNILKWIIILGVITEVISSTLWHWKVNNLPLFHIYPLIELGLLSLIYRRVLNETCGLNLIPFLSGGVIIFSLINSLFFQSIFTFSSNAITLESALLVFYALSYFYTLLKKEAVNELELHPMFWINCGVLIYFSGSFIIYAYSNYMLSKSLEVQDIMWTFHAVFNIIIHLFFARALWIKVKI